MQKFALILLALAVGACVDPVPDALADGITRPAKKARHVNRAPRCLHDRCGFPVVCPDGTCNSIYGAYGPYGGALYWSRYSFGGWNYR
jgi:hypothetical protein